MPLMVLATVAEVVLVATLVVVTVLVGVMMLALLGKQDRAPYFDGLPAANHQVEEEQGVREAVEEDFEERFLEAPEVK